MWCIAIMLHNSILHNILPIKKVCGLLQDVRLYIFDRTARRYLTVNHESREKHISYHLITKLNTALERGTNEIRRNLHPLSHKSAPFTAVWRLSDWSPRRELIPFLQNLYALEWEAHSYWFKLILVFWLCSLYLSVLILFLLDR